MQQAIVTVAIALVCAGILARPFLGILARPFLGSWRLAAEVAVGAGANIAMSCALVFAAEYAVASPLLRWSLLLPTVCAAGFFGRTPLGIWNFLLLQWLGVRLRAEWHRHLEADGPRGRWYSMNAPPRGTPVTWGLDRWVWPLTGWWSPYRWIARRP